MALPRIPLKYFKTISPLDTWKGRLGWIAGGVCVLWVGVSSWMGKEVHFHASRGQVASVHQVWNDQCSTCHVPFQAMSSHSWTPGFLPFLHPAAASEQKCQSCHAGPDHHAGAMPALSCGSCHREHRGAEASLVHMGDADCTQCHRNLKAHYGAIARSAFEPPIHNSVPAFKEGLHPKFRSVQKDPGQLRFSHAQHMTPGVPAIDPLTKQPGGGLWTLGDIAPSYRERYRNQQPAEQRQDSDFVHLSCASCHRLETDDFNLTPAQISELPAAAQPARSSGAYMLPITYENQCKACHPLSVAERLPDGKLREVAVPHRLQPDALQKHLGDYFTAQAARGQTGFGDRPAAVPLPGKLPQGALQPSLAELVARNLKNAQEDLYARPIKKNCALCHYLEKETAGEQVTWKVVPTQTPQVWLRHARFDHAAHRALDCRACHAAGYTSVDSTDVLIPDIDNCVQCHAPPASHGGKVSGGARHHCTECHRYHNAAHPAQGLGALRRGAPHPVGIEDFLRGKLEKP